MCVYIYICSSYLDTVTILKSSRSMEKTKKKGIITLML